MALDGETLEATDLSLWPQLADLGSTLPELPRLGHSLVPVDGNIYLHLCRQVHPGIPGPELEASAHLGTGCLVGN